MLFTQDSTKLQKLCPYLHVVSLLRDQIPGRAWNPDNSSFDPAPVGSTTLFVLPASSWPCLRQRTSEDRREEKKITDANTCRAKKKKIVTPLPGELWFPFPQKEAVIKNVFITRENVFRYPRSRGEGLSITVLQILVQNVCYSTSLTQLGYCNCS